MLYIFDGLTEERVANLSNEPNQMLGYQNAKSIEKINGDFTLEFEVSGNHDDSKHICENNLVAYKDVDGDFQMFRITKIEDNSEGGNSTITAFAEHVFYELLDDITVYEGAWKSNAYFALGQALKSSRWTVGGTVGDFPEEKTLYFHYSNALDNLLKIAEAFEGELKFNTTFDDVKITGRSVQLHSRRGMVTGRRFEWCRDLKSVKRTVDMTGLKTALYGLGNDSGETMSNGDAKKITFKDVEYNSTFQHLRKPKGQEYIENTEALELFGLNNGKRHRFGVFEFGTDLQYDLVVETAKELLKVSVPQITYELSVTDLEHLTGYENHKVRLGDTVMVIDKGFKRDIRSEARAIEIQRDLVEPINTELVLGNFIPNITTLGSQIQQIQQIISKKESIWDKSKFLTIDKEQEVPNFIINEVNLPSNVPEIPSGIKGLGFMENVAITWDMDVRLHVTHYELFASQESGFVPSPENMIFSGKSGGYVHAVLPRETWYYKLRAVNSKGFYSDFTTEISVTASEIKGEYIEELSIGSSQIKDLTADKIVAGILDASKVKVTNLDATQITVGELDGKLIKAGSLSASQIDVTAFELVPNPTRQGSLSGWNRSESGFTKITQLPKLLDGRDVLELKTDGVNQFSSIVSNKFKIDLTESYEISMEVYRETLTGSFFTGVFFYGKNGELLNAKRYKYSDGSLIETEDANLVYGYRQEGAIHDGLNNMKRVTFPVQSPDNKEPIAAMNGQFAIFIPKEAVECAIYLVESNEKAVSASYIHNIKVNKVDDGVISFDRARGGSLTVGGQNSQVGEITILDGDGQEVGKFGGGTGGYSTLNVDRIIGTRNVVMASSQTHDNYVSGTESLEFYIDGINGDDNNLGVRGKPLRTIQEAINRLPKHLNMDAYIRIVPMAYREDLKIFGFEGNGTLFLQPYIPDVKAIRVQSNGNSTNIYNQIVEFWGLNIAGFDRKALSGNYSSSTYMTVNGTTASADVMLKDGNITSSQYVTFGSGKQWMQLTLTEKQDISGVHLWWLFSDNRTINEFKVEISEDDKNFYPIFDEGVSGAFKSTSNGYDGGRFKIYGDIDIQNSSNIQIWGLWSQQLLTSLNPAINVKNSYLYLSDSIIIGNKRSDSGILSTLNSWVRAVKTEISHVKNYAIHASYHSRLEVVDCYGGSNGYGLHSAYGSTLSGYTASPIGSIANTLKSFDGQILSTIPTKTGSYATERPLDLNQETKIWNSISQSGYRVDKNIWEYGTVAQGVAYEQGEFTGLYYFSGYLKPTLTAAQEISKMRVYVKRASIGGSAKETIFLRTHGYLTQPSGVPQINPEVLMIELSHGEGKWIDLPSNMVARFKDGTAQGIGTYIGSTGDKNKYARMDIGSKIEATYRI